MEKTLSKVAGNIKYVLIESIIQYIINQGRTHLILEESKELHYLHTDYIAPESFKTCEQ